MASSNYLSQISRDFIIGMINSEFLWKFSYCSVAETLRNKCVLVPRSSNQFLGSQYWLVVECDRLVDDVEKWGISMETFYSTQKAYCYTPQGNFLF